MKKQLGPAAARCSLGLFATVATIALATSASAQESASPAETAISSADAPGAASSDAGDIVVTAQFRSQKLQDTPIAITAMNAAMLEARSVVSVADLASGAPSVLLRPAPANYGNATQAFIRGIGQGDSNPALEPGVGMYIDDVYYGTMLGSAFDLIDLSRVEILRGPQGTLAGKNSIGGAIKLYSVKPDGNDGGYLEATAGSYQRYELRGGVNMTVVDDVLFARLSGVAKKRDGYVTRLDYACATGDGSVPSAVAGTSCKLGTEGGQRLLALRGAVRWLPTAAIEVNVAADYTDDHSEASPTKLISVQATNNTGIYTPGVAGGSKFLTGPKSYTNYSTFIDNGYIGRTGIDNGVVHGPVAFDPVNRVKNWGVSATIDWELSSSLKLTSITAYRKLDGFYSVDHDNTPITGQLLSFAYDNRQLTQELRLNGDIGSLADWTLGGFYYDGKSHYAGTAIIQPTTASINSFTGTDTIPTKTKAVFAHTVFHPFAGFNVTGGLRYTKDDKSYAFERRYISDPALTSPYPAGAVDNRVGTYSGDHVDYRIGVDYRWMPGLLTYAQVSTGFRGGGVNPRPFNGAQLVSFDPETLTSYEIGFKSDLFDRKVRINGAAYISRYKDIILTNTSPAPNATPVNAGDGRIKGLELEIEARPLEGLTVNASGSLLGFDFTRIGAAGATIAGVTLDNMLPFTPKRKLDVGAQYAIALGKFGTLTPRADMSYQSSIFTNVSNTPLTRVPGYTLVNAKLTWLSGDEITSVAFGVTNLANKFYYLSNFVSTGTAGYVVGQPGRPREWSLTLKRKF